ASARRRGRTRARGARAHLPIPPPKPLVSLHAVPGAARIRVQNLGRVSSIIRSDDQVDAAEPERWTHTTAVVTPDERVDAGGLERGEGELGLDVVDVGAHDDEIRIGDR